VSTRVSIHTAQVVGTFFEKRFVIASYFCVHITVYFFLCRLKTNYIMRVRVFILELTNRASDAAA
jgi:hypothetical protein